MFPLLTSGSSSRKRTLPFEKLLQYCGQSHWLWLLLDGSHVIFEPITVAPSLWCSIWLSMLGLMAWNYQQEKQRCLFLLLLKMMYKFWIFKYRNVIWGFKSFIWNFLGTSHLKLELRSDLSCQGSQRKSWDVGGKFRSNDWTLGEIRGKWLLLECGIFSWRDTQLVLCNEVNFCMNLKNEFITHVAKMR